MKRASNFMGTMSDAFTLPLVSEDSFREAMWVHFLAGFDGLDSAESPNVALLELNTTFAYLFTYAEFRNGMLRNADSIAKHFGEAFRTYAVEETFEPVEQVLWPNPDPRFCKPEEMEMYCATVPGVINLTADDVLTLSIQMSNSVAEEIINNGNIPTYLDIALGYQHGSRIDVMGDTVHDAVVVIDDDYTPSGIGRGLKRSNSFVAGTWAPFIRV